MTWNPTKSTTQSISVLSAYSIESDRSKGEKNAMMHEIKQKVPTSLTIRASEKLFKGLI